MDDRNLVAAGFLGNRYRVGRGAEQHMAPAPTRLGRRGIYYANLLAVCQLERDDLLRRLLPDNRRHQLVGKQVPGDRRLRLDGAVGKKYYCFKI